MLRGGSRTRSAWHRSWELRRILQRVEWVYVEDRIYHRRQSDKAFIFLIWGFCLFFCSSYSQVGYPFFISTIYTQVGNFSDMSHF